MIAPKPYAVLYHRSENADAARFRRGFKLSFPLGLSGIENDWRCSQELAESGG